MNRIQQDSRRVVRTGTQYPATIIDVHGDRASAQLSGNGAKLHNLAVIGGPVEIGEAVSVDFTTPDPTIVATAKDWLSIEDILRALGKLPEPLMTDSFAEFDKVVCFCIDDPTQFFLLGADSWNGYWDAIDIIESDGSTYGYMRRWGIRLPPTEHMGSSQSSSGGTHIPLYMWGVSKEQTILDVHSFYTCYGTYFENITFDFYNPDFNPGLIPEGIQLDAWANTSVLDEFARIGNPIYSPSNNYLLLPSQLFNGYIFRNCDFRNSWIGMLEDGDTDQGHNISCITVNPVSHLEGYRDGDDIAIFENCKFFSRNSYEPHLVQNMDDWAFPSSDGYRTHIYLYDCEVDCLDKPMSDDLDYVDVSSIGTRWLGVPNILGLNNHDILKTSDRAALDHIHGSSGSSGGYDENALHDNELGEIYMVTEKTDPVGADLLLIEDSEASYAKKKVQIANLPFTGGSSGSGGGASTFLDLTDTPSAYTGQGGKLVSVKNTVDGLEFVNAPTAGSDGNAIHDNVADEIHQVTEKVTPADNDEILIEDSAASWAKKRLKISNLPSSGSGGGDMYKSTYDTNDDGKVNSADSADAVPWSGVSSKPDPLDATAIHDNVAAEISAVTEKASPVSADLILIEDSEASNAKKRVQIGNLPSSGSGGSSTFLGLTDTPSSFSGQGGKYAKVNDGESALEFVTPDAGTSGSAFIGTVLESGTVGASGLSAITLDNIPAGYNYLEIRIYGRSTYTGGDTDAVSVEFNDDSTAANYWRQRFTAGFGTNHSSGQSGDNWLAMLATEQATNTYSISTWVGIIDGYDNENFHKNIRTKSNARYQNTTSGYIEWYENWWENTNAITKISLTLSNGNFAEGTQYTIIGYKNQAVPSGLVSDIGARVYNSSNQSITGSSFQALTFNSERWDTDGIFDGGNPTRLTCQTAGSYVIGGGVRFAINATGQRIIRVVLNGTTTISIFRDTEVSSSAFADLETTTIYDLDVGDYIELEAFQDSGGSLNVLSSANISPEFMMQLLSASGAAASASDIGARVYLASDQTDIATSTTTAIDFDTEDYDTDNLWTSGSGSRFTINTAGKYHIWGSVEWESNTDNARTVYIRKNGSVDIAWERDGGSSTGDVKKMGVSTIIDLEIGDYVELAVRHTAGVALDIQASGITTAFAIQKISSGGGDADAIHDNVAGEISALTEKTVPVGADLVLIEDSEASNAKKKVQISKFADVGVVNGRLTLESGVPVSTSDQSAKTTLYFAPYMGNNIGLFTSGSVGYVRDFSELSLSLTGLTASTPYDIWIYDNAGTLTLDKTAWTDDTTRATAIVSHNGIYVKSGDVTRRYLGTIYINSTGGQTEDTNKERYVWNYYNRVKKLLYLYEDTQHTYTSATFRIWNNSTVAGETIHYAIIGVAEDAIKATGRFHVQSINNANQVGSMYCRINTTYGVSTYFGGAAGYQRNSLPVDHSKMPIEGLNYVAAYESGNNPSITYYNVVIYTNILG